jgi:predicted RNA polymerase sigma factor
MIAWAKRTSTVPASWRMIFSALKALALRAVCGMSPAEIGAAFLTSEAAISKRLVRARQLIRDLRLPFAVPDLLELPQRLDGVLAALYLLFNEGYKASSGNRLIREELCHDAIRLTRLLASHLTTEKPATKARLALMCLNAARLKTRVGLCGEIVLLNDQDRSMWDPIKFAKEFSPSARHRPAMTLAPTTSKQASPPAIASPRTKRLPTGPDAGLAALETINGRNSLMAQHLYHAIRASFLAGLGRAEDARAAYRRAADLARCDAKREHLAARSRAP